MASAVRCSSASFISHPASTIISRSSRRCFSSASPLRAVDYDDTVHNLKIGKHTRVIYQGFTGRVATRNAQDSLAYGTNIVGGVTPGKEGEHLGLPLYPDIITATRELKPDATAVFVAASQCGRAITSAIEAEIPLIVAVAEHIPFHDIMRVASILRTQSRSRLVGANAPGIIAPISFCRIGFQPLSTFAPGHIGIAAKSGTLSYEAVASITRAGLGQSLVIGMGGDIIAGTNFVDSLRVFEADDQTEGIVLIGEVGGRAEEDAADWIKDYLKRTTNPKPIAALVGGKCARPNTVMGHAGAWAAAGEHNAHEKYNLLKEAGAHMVHHPEEFGGVMKTLLEQSGCRVSKIPANVQSNQRRGYHTLRQSPTLMRSSLLPPARVSGPPLRHGNSEQQHRSLFIDSELAPAALFPYLSQIPGIDLVLGDPLKDGYYIGIVVDRTERCPCIAVAPTEYPYAIHAPVKHFHYNWRLGPSEERINQAIAHLQLDSAPPEIKQKVVQLIETLVTMYRETEAINLTGCMTIGASGNLMLHQPTMNLVFDDAYCRHTTKRSRIHDLRQWDQEVPEEVEAQKYGIVFVRYDEPDANIGTLVNGAGLAMNTVDALRSRGGKATNFLDTGGKATAETVKKSFELILRDPRVKVIFVNIFGGLTDAVTIAEGILLANKEVDMKNVPVVVRLRGTNEEAGQRIIAQSGLGLNAYDKFDEAARAVIELANR